MTMGVLLMSWEEPQKLQPQPCHWVIPCQPVSEPKYKMLRPDPVISGPAHSEMPPSLFWHLSPWAMHLQEFAFWTFSWGGEGESFSLMLSVPEVSFNVSLKNHHIVPVNRVLHKTQVWEEHGYKNEGKIISPMLTLENTGFHQALPFKITVSSLTVPTIWRSKEHICVRTVRKMKPQQVKGKGQRDCSVVKSTCCSSRGPGVNFQHSCDS